MRITKAKLKNRSLDVEYAEKKTVMTPENEMVESSRDVAVKCYDVCHDSLVETFDRLKTHAVLIADVREAIKVENAIQMGISLDAFDLEELKTIFITGFVIVGSEEDGSEGVMIICQKKTGTRVLNITTPTVKFEDPDYAYCSELQSVVNDCIMEVEEYMAGKVAVKQLEMNFDEGFDEGVTVKEEKEPKKRGRKAKIEAFSGDDMTISVSDSPTITEHQEVA